MKLKKRSLNTKKAMKGLIEKAKKKGVNMVNIAIMEEVLIHGPTKKQIAFYGKMVEGYAEPIPAWCAPIEI